MISAGRATDKGSAFQRSEKAYVVLRASVAVLELDRSDKVAADQARDGVIHRGASGLVGSEAGVDEGTDVALHGFDVLVLGGLEGKPLAQESACGHGFALGGDGIVLGDKVNHEVVAGSSRVGFDLHVLDLDVVIAGLKAGEGSRDAIECGV